MENMGNELLNDFIFMFDIDRSHVVRVHTISRLAFF